MKKKITAVPMKTEVSEFYIVGRVNAPFKSQPKDGFNLGFSPMSEAAVESKTILTPAQQRQADRIASGNGAGTIENNVFEPATKCFSQVAILVQQMKSLRAGTLCTFTCTQKQNRYFSEKNKKWVDDFNLYVQNISILPDMQTAKEELNMLISEQETRRFVPVSAPKRDSEEVVQTAYEEALEGVF